MHVLYLKISFLGLKIKKLFLIKSFIDTCRENISKNLLQENDEFAAKRKQAQESYCALQQAIQVRKSLTEFFFLKKWHRQLLNAYVTWRQSFSMFVSVSMWPFYFMELMLRNKLTCSYENKALWRSSDSRGCRLARQFFIMSSLEYRCE